MSNQGRPQVVFPRLTSTVRTLLIVLFCAYVAQLIADNWLGLGMASLLAMRPAGGALWQLVTFVLVDLGHPVMFLVGLLFLWWALSPFEAAFGPRRTLQLCLACALGASVPAWLVGFMIAPSPPLFGAHVIWYGAITATTFIYRDREMGFFGLGSMTARQFMLLLVVLAVLMFLFSQNHTQFVGTLGGMAAGVAFVRWMARPRTPPRIKRRRGDAARARGLKVIEGGGNDADEPPKWLN